MSLITDIISGVISPITNVISSWLNKKQDVDLEKFKVDGQVDITLVNAQVAIFQAQIDLAKSKIMQALYVVFAMPLAFTLWKVYIWDAALHLGTTDAVRGDVATWAGIIVGFIFFHSALEGWKRRT